MKWTSEWFSFCSVFEGPPCVKMQVCIAFNILVSFFFYCTLSDSICYLYTQTVYYVYIILDQCSN